MQASPSGIDWPATLALVAGIVGLSVAVGGLLLSRRRRNHVRPLLCRPTIVLPRAAPIQQASVYTAPESGPSSTDRSQPPVYRIFSASDEASYHAAGQ